MTLCPRAHHFERSYIGPNIKTGEVDNVHYLVTIAPVRDGIYLAASGQSSLEVDVLEAQKMGKCKNLS